MPSILSKNRKLRSSRQLLLFNEGSASSQYSTFTAHDLSTEHPAIERQRYKVSAPPEEWVCSIVSAAALVAILIAAMVLLQFISGKPGGPSTKTPTKELSVRRSYQPL
jgi:hypothetical protein